MPFDAIPQQVPDPVKCLCEQARDLEAAHT